MIPEKKSRMSMMPRGSVFTESQSPMALGVDRYNGLSERGDDMLSRHLQAMAVCLGEPEQDEESSTAESSTAGEPNFSPKSLRHESWVADANDEESVAGEQSPKGGKEPDGSSSPRSTSPRGRSRRETRGKQRTKDSSKARTELLISKLNEPLCKELCERKITTTWVSPALSRLCTPETDKNLDRNLLRKSPSEARQLNMAVAPSIVSRPASAPMRKPGTPQSPQSHVRPHHVGHGHGATPTGHSASAPSLGQRHKGGGETIVLEMQQLNRRTMMQRLDAQTKFFRQKAFGEYMKEYDIFTGDKKARLNGSKLKEEEKSYVAEMNKIVGGQALRLNPFTKSQAARMAAVAVGSR